MPPLHLHLRPLLDPLLLFTSLSLLLYYLYTNATHPANLNSTSIGRGSGADSGGRGKGQLNLAKMRYPDRFGFPEWFGPLGEGVVEVGNGNEDLRGKEEKRVLILIDPALAPSHQPFLSYLHALSSHLPNFHVTTRLRHPPAHETQSQNGGNRDEVGLDVDIDGVMPTGNERWIGEWEGRESECEVDWVWTFGGEPFPPSLREDCRYVTIHEPGIHLANDDIITHLSANVAIFDSTRIDQYSVVSRLYSGVGRVGDIGLYGFGLPAADPSIFYPDQKPLSTLRKQVTYFTTEKTWRTQAEWDERLPGGWVGYRIPPNDIITIPTSGKIDTGKLINDALIASHKREDKVATVMRHSGVCVFDDWSSGQITERMVQAMLSGCVVAAVQPRIQDDALSELFLLLPKPNVHPDSSSPLALEALTTRTVSLALRSVSHADLDRKALWAFVYAREKLTFGRKVEEVWRLVEGWEEGQRGVMMPFGFAKHDLR